MIRRIIISALIICLTTSLSFATPRDVQLNWAATEINTLIENGIMLGYKDGRFKPDRNITREEAIVLLVSFAKQQGLIADTDLLRGELPTASDAKNVWSLKEIQFLLSSGIIKPDSNNQIRPYALLTREDLAEMLYNYFVYFNLLKNNEVGSPSPFTDIATSYAVKPITTMQKLGILKGYPNGSYKPKNNITRAEIAGLLFKMSGLNPIASTLTLPRYNIIEVPYLSQIYPVNAWLGCEATSLLMGLHAKGYSVNVDLLAFLDDMPKTESNPAKGFVGSPYLVDKAKKTRTTIYPPVLAKWASAYGNVSDFSGSSVKEIRAEILDGNPVVVYATLYWEKPFYRTFDIEGQIQKLLSNNHAVLATGYDSDAKKYYISDPYNLNTPNEEYRYWIDAYTFEKIYNERKHALVIQ